MDRYDIREELGRGGFGRVYLADDRRLDREVAIKVLKQSDDFTDTDHQRFRREINIAASLSHPNVVTVYDGGDHDGLSYLVMRYVEGRDLRHELREGPLPAERLLSVVEQIASALDYAHGRGLVHRDVKPANILCETGSDRVFLADFGISRPVDQTTGEQLTLAGLGPATFYYAAPEQLRTGERIDARTDVYAFGCVLYECLTASRPFEGKIAAVLGAHLQEPPPRVTDVRHDLSGRWDDVVAKAMAKAPDERYQHCGDVADAVAALAPSAAGTFIDERAMAHTVAVGGDTPHPRVVAPPAEPAGRAGETQRFAAPEIRDAGPALRQPALRQPAPRPSRGRRAVAALVAVLAALTGWLFWPQLSSALNDGRTGDDAQVAGNQEDEAAQEDGLDAAQRQLLATVGVFEATDCRSVQNENIDNVGTSVSCSSDEQAPTRVVFREFEDAAARDAAFAGLSAARRANADCRAGHDAVHPYRGSAGDGAVVCNLVDGIAGMSWTVPGEPVMASARLDGSESLDALYGWWDQTVGRDAADRLPDCLADQGLIDRGAITAVQCEMTGGVASIVSHAQFASVADMDTWYDAVAGDARERRLQEVRASTDPAACNGLGAANELRWVGAEIAWTLDDAQGRLLCFVNESDQNTLFWTNDATAVGSVAVSSAANAPLDQLVGEWTTSPYRNAD
ncbi:MAG TPA: serine/threonine-protein kinase [Euzebyales bacterium]|nr:serine/threonine-protein kinase [Euzebyales bacterium]